MRQVRCDCGSPYFRTAMYDARAIFLCYACLDCAPKKMSRYRKEVLTDPNYEAEEPIDDDEHWDDWDEDYDDEFADPTGHSALRKATPSNPRNLPCPNCGQENRLTPKDRDLGYQCDECADKLERGWE